MTWYKKIYNVFSFQENKTGFDIPFFLLNRRISNLDVPVLQLFFQQNGIEYFREITSEMIRSFLKHSYAEAIDTIELLGLYGVNFKSEKLKRFSYPPSNDYKILKFSKSNYDIVISYTDRYEVERIHLQRYLSDRHIHSTYMLNGMKFDILLNSLNISENAFLELLKPQFYNKDELSTIYSKEDMETVEYKMENLGQIPLSECKQGILRFPIQHIPSYIAEMHLPRPDFSVRLSNVLNNFHLNSVKDVLKLSKEELLTLPNFGRKCLIELEIFLHSKNVYLDTPFNIYDEENNPPKIPLKNEEETFIEKQKISSFIAELELPRPEFSVRLSNVLKSNNLTTVRDILDVSDAEFLQLKNFGRTSLKELNQFCLSYNIERNKPYEIVKIELPPEEQISEIDKLFVAIKNFEESINSDEKRNFVYKGRIKSADHKTLQLLADELLLTRERIRQIEKSLFNTLTKIIDAHISAIISLFNKYGDIIDYKGIRELYPYTNYLSVLCNTINFDGKYTFEINNTLDLLASKNVEFDELNIEAKDDFFYLSLEEIRSILREKLLLLLSEGASEDSVNNFNNVLNKIVEYQIETFFYYDENKHKFLLEKYNRDAEKIDLIFKELYPNGVLLRQKNEEVYEKFVSTHPELDYSSAKALEARLSGHSKNIILTGNGYYQHIDNIYFDKEAIDFALDKCENKFLQDPHPFLITVIFEKYQEYFKQHGIFSHYLLFSLLKRQKDPRFTFSRLTVYGANDEIFSQLEYFENYFVYAKGIIPEKKVEEHFSQLGWNELRIGNYLNLSNNVFKISTGYFHKDNVSCNIDKLHFLMDKANAKVEECGYVSLNVIREKNFVDWLDVFEREDLDAKSMVSIIRAFYPEYPYEINSAGLISSGEKLKSHEILYNWMTQKCMEEAFVTTAKIMSFCEENKFHRYNTKAQIKNQLLEIADDCWVTYDYLGLNQTIEEKIHSKIDVFFKNEAFPYICITDLLVKMELPALNNDQKWNEYLIRSILENNGQFSLCNLVVINPNQEKIKTMDFIVACEIVKFAKTWYMPADKLERLLRRNKILRKNETLSHKGIQNLLFCETSCVELRQNKHVCIKAEYREVFNV